MSYCRYFKEGQCELLTLLVDQNGFHPTQAWCEKKCGPNNIDKQMQHLHKRGYSFSVPPSGVDLLEWSRRQITEGAIDLHLKSECGSCGKIKNIIKGFGKLAWERISKGKPNDTTIERSEICLACEHRTFLNVLEWGIGFVKDKDLPINHEPDEWDALWCSKCKCCIEAKIRVTDEKCSINKWPNADRTE